MKKLINLLICAILSHFTVSAQITYNPSVQSQNNRGKILSVNITNNETIIKIQFPKGGTHGISSATVLVPCDAWNISDARRSNLKAISAPPPGMNLTQYDIKLYSDAVQRVREGRKDLSERGWLIRHLGNDKLDTYYKPSRGANYMVLELHFDKLNPGENNVYIREIIGDTGYEWYGIKINNPYPTTPTTGYNEFSIKVTIDEQNDGIVGIYEQIGESKYKLGCIKDGDKYKLVYLGSSEKFKQWRIGDVKSVLRSTATPYLFKADYFMLDKTKEEVYIMFDGQSMKITFEDGSSSAYLKMYPTTSPSGNNTSEESADWSGSGFALSNGYICTNYHVVDGAKSIEIRGVQGDFTTSYSAKVIVSDKFNDLAILKVDDADFKGFGTIPYKVKTSMADVGEEIFVLGYPMTTTMGDEIKLTTGVVSSRTGYQGDVSLYQISAPIQPGNSGGPLFDSQGNLIGIVSAKHTGAENVGYAIKASYLRSLMESSLTEDVLPVNNSVSSLPLTEKVKKVKKFVYFIECNSNDYLNTTNERVLSIDETPKNEHIVRKRGPNGEIIIEHPNCESTTSYKCVIDKITITDKHTIIDIIANNSIKGGGYYQYCNVNPNIHIRHLNSVYKLIKAEGIDISPQKTFFQRINQDIHFQLFFEPICIDAKNIDLIEGANSDWNWYNIKID